MSHLGCFCYFHDVDLHQSETIPVLAHNIDIYVDLSNWHNPPALAVGETARELSSDKPSLQH